MFEWLRGSSSSDVESRPSTNEEWLSALQGPPPNPAAIDELRTQLVRGLRAVLKKRVPRHAEALAEDFAQDALIKILDELDTFRGESQFTTWAQKVAVRTAFTELRRKRWENTSLDDLLDEEGPFQPEASSGAQPHPDPEDATNQQLLVDQVQDVIQSELTDRQRTAIQAIMRDMPLQEVARRMDTNRNALYKVIHDARRKVKDALEDRGLSADQLLAELN
jgi:RNA polymerase sigma-70 factor (ECF subfamily)